MLELDVELDRPFDAGEQGEDGDYEPTDAELEFNLQKLGMFFGIAIEAPTDEPTEAHATTPDGTIASEPGPERGSAA